MSDIVIQRAQRCAIYTRRSGENPWDREFNSIESQRDICTAYVTCQQHRNWVPLPQSYDDAGQSGSTLDRPALQRLLRDIECAQVDIVVIYKIDRLTRSLADFIRLIEVLDRYHVKFVSVTQAFDTSDSMGRLVLNILLTFAQFERELMADRIRDKVGAMKRRGQHVGGGPPFGYDVVERRLVVNPVEAQHVRALYRRYLEVKSCNALYREVKAQGLRTKIWTTRGGKVRGGQPASCGMVYHILGSPIYVGRVPHNGNSYPGEHEAIIDQETWDAAQQLRAERSMFSGNLKPTPNFLRGLFRDSHGRRMVITYCSKNGVRYRHYVSEQSRWAAREGVKRYRMRGDDFEELVLATVNEVLRDRERVRAALLDLGRHGLDLNRVPQRSNAACVNLGNASVERLGEILSSLIVEGEISPYGLVLVFRSSEIVRFVAWDGIGIFEGDRAAWSPNEPTFTIRRPLNEMRWERALVMPLEPIAPERRGKFVPGLVELIKEARRAQAAVDKDRDIPVEAHARRFGWSASKFCRVLRLNYLAPDIIAAILAGAHPKGLTRYKLLLGTLPLDWDLQRQLFGFPSRPDHKMYAPRDDADAALTEHQAFLPA